MERLVAGSPFHTVNGLAFAPDGRLLVASMMGESIFAFDVARGGTSEVVVGSPAGGSDDLVMLPNGDLIWTAILEGVVRRRDAAGNLRDLAANLPGANFIGLTRDGKRLFMGQVFLGEGLWEIDLKGVEPPRLVVDHTGGINAFEFGADGMFYGPSWLRGQVVRIDPDSGATTIITEGLKHPGAVVFDAQERLYVLDDATGEVFRVDLPSGTKTSVARLATATDNMAFGPNGRLYVSNMADNSLHEIEVETGAVREIVKGALAFPRAIAVAATAAGDVLYVADSCAYRTVEARTGTVTDVARAVVSEVLFPTAVSVNERHVVLASDVMGVVQLVDRGTGKFLQTIPGFDRPGAAIELADGSLIVSEPLAGRLLWVRGQVREVLVAGLNLPVGLLDAHDGTIYVTESGAGRLLAVGVASGEATEIAVGLGAIRAVAPSPDGTLVLLDGHARTLTQLDPRTGTRRIIAQHLAVGYLPGPYARSGGLAVGSDGTIYVAADAENALYRITPARD